MYCRNDRNNNPTSTNHKLRNLKTFFNYLQSIDLYTDKSNPSKVMKYLIEDIQIDVFSEKQIKQMLNHFIRQKQKDKTFWAYRDYTVIYTLIGTGCRLGELCNLRWKDIDIINYSITVVGKKRKQRSIPMTDKLKKEFAEYKVFCEQYFSNKELTYVFVDRDNKQLTPNSLKCVFKRLKEQMQFKDVRLSAHTFRHYFCCQMIKSGCDVLTLKNILGHESLTMVNRYYGLFGSALRSLNDKHNPLNNLDI